MAKESNLSKHLNILSIIIISLLVILVILGYRNGLFDSPDRIEEFISSFGVWAPVAFLTFQIFQVCLPVIPGGIVLLAGVLMFGPVDGFILNYVGVSLGSFITFNLSKKYGKKIIVSLFGKKKYDKYVVKLEDKRYNVFFALAILFPIAPDALLCYITGLSNMSFKKFATIILLAKPLTISFYSFGIYFGYEDFINFIK